MRLQTPAGVYFGEVSGSPKQPDGRGALFNITTGVLAFSYFKDGESALNFGIKGKQHFIQVFTNTGEEGKLISACEIYKDSSGAKCMRGADFYTERESKKFEATRKSSVIYQ